MQVHAYHRRNMGLTGGNLAANPDKDRREPPQSCRPEEYQCRCRLRLERNGPVGRHSISSKKPITVNDGVVPLVDRAAVDDAFDVVSAASADDAVDVPSKSYYILINIAAWLRENENQFSMNVRRRQCRQSK